MGRAPDAPDTTDEDTSRMTTPDSKLGKTVLMIGHVAGMVDLVALPLWVGALMQHYGFGPERAGLTATLFLIGVVASSLWFAPRFNRLPRRTMAAAGFGVAAVAFFAAAALPVVPGSFARLGVLHAAAGLGVGCGLSFTHGSMGRSRNPHASFALAGMVLGGFAVLFLGGMPVLLQGRSPAWLFLAFAALMAFAAVSVGVAFPQIAEPSVGAPGAGHGGKRQPIGTAAWLAIAVVVCMTLNQAMVFAFLERVGMSRGFGAERVNAVLLAVGLVNLTPALLAALLQKRLAAVHVALVAPVIQATLAWFITSSTTFGAYAATASVFVAVLIFAHTFLFGLIARLDASGRAVAATPAMMMLGSAVGPLLGGGVVRAVGYAGIGWASLVVALAAVGSMLGVVRALGWSRAVTLPNRVRLSQSS